MRCPNCNWYFPEAISRYCCLRCPRCYYDYQAIEIDPLVLKEAPVSLGWSFHPYEWATKIKKVKKVKKTNEKKEYKIKIPEPYHGTANWNFKASNVKYKKKFNK